MTMSLTLVSVSSKEPCTIFHHKTWNDAISVAKLHMLTDLRHEELQYLATFSPLPVRLYPVKITMAALHIILCSYKLKTENKLTCFA